MGMFVNSTTCDIYIGKGAGKKLLKDINNAKYSVKIISPYLSPNLVRNLIELSERNIKVTLLTRGNIDESYGSYQEDLKNLILQEKRTDYKAVEDRAYFSKNQKLYHYAAILIFTISIGGLYWLRFPEFLYMTGLALLLYVVSKRYKDKWNNKVVYSYSYSQLFPFRLYLSPEEFDYNTTFIHGKIYLIDNSIAYLGSLNFTKRGTKYNYETRIRTEERDAVSKINHELKNLINRHKYNKLNILDWGPMLYDEPIN